MKRALILGEAFAMKRALILGEAFAMKRALILGEAFAMKRALILLIAIACVSFAAFDPASAATKKPPKPKELTAAQIEEQRPKVMAYCKKKYGYGRPVQVRYKFNKWYCYYQP
jgi:hypothetical protein